MYTQIGEHARSKISLDGSICAIIPEGVRTRSDRPDRSQLTFPIARSDRKERDHKIIGSPERDKTSILAPLRPRIDPLGTRRKEGGKGDRRLITSLEAPVSYIHICGLANTPGYLGNDLGGERKSH